MVEVKIKLNCSDAKYIREHYMPFWECGQVIERTIKKVQIELRRLISEEGSF